MYGAVPPRPTYFRLFTKESLTKIERRIRDEKQARVLAKQQAEQGDVTGATAVQLRDDLEPNAMLEVGRTLPAKLGDFPPELYGKPIEELDEYYFNKYTFMVVAKDKTIFRFNAENALFLLSPFNPVRRLAIYILTHPLFVMLVILVNCTFMAFNQEIPKSEEIFTGIYTVEGTIKVLARGMILTNFTYLRDGWNWLDFIVVSLAYITMAFPLGNLAALRTFRVLRALKTVAVVPGLKTIVGALLEAVRRLRDVMILTVFVLSIFALVGLQLYQGSMKRKCVLNPDPEWLNNATEPEKHNYYQSTNASLWFMESSTSAMLCGESEDAGQCPENFSCQLILNSKNPNYGYTNFDNFAWALLCAFRLMTQDYWENLYQQVIRANGRIHMLFFIVVIFMGSFYLVNLILAIVAMSYDDCQKKDQEEADEADEADEEASNEDVSRRLAQLEEAVMRKSPSDDFSMESSVDAFMPCRIKLSKDKDSISIHSERVAGTVDGYRRFSIVNGRGTKTCSSVPGSPTRQSRRRNSRTRRFSWRRNLMVTSNGYCVQSGAEWPPVPVPQRRVSEMPLPPPDYRQVVNGFLPSRHRQTLAFVTPCLDNLDLPYADAEDDSADGAMVGCASTDEQKQQQQQQQLALPVTSHELHTPSGNQQWLSHSGCLLEGPPQPIVNSALRRHSTVLRRSDSRRVPSHGGQHRARAMSSHHAEFAGGDRHRPGRAVDDARRQPGGEPTHFRWNASVRIKKPRSNADNLFVHKKSICSDTGVAPDGDTTKDFLFADNPYVCRTPSTTIDIQDVLVLKDLFNHASGKHGLGFLSQEGMLKEYIKSKCLWLLFGWECHPAWHRMARFVELFIMDAFVDLFITLCIVINTLFMAMEHAGMSDQLVKTLAIGNYVFTTIFTTEAVLKIVALGLFTYLKDKWNCFDLVIVMLSLFEMGLSNLKGMSILRSFRLLRVFKLAKSWPTLNLLIGIIGRTMGALGNLCFVLAIIVFIFAVMGMQLYGPNYIEKYFHPSPVPRWNFKDFLHSFMIVFRVLCGEWIESMWDCMQCSSYVCIPFFLLTMIVGNLVVLNLFLALLLSSFGAESFQHSQEDVETNKLQEAVDRITRFANFIRLNLVAVWSRLRSQYKRQPMSLYNGSGMLNVAAGFKPLGFRPHTTDAILTNGPRLALALPLVLTDFTCAHVPRPNQQHSTVPANSVADDEHHQQQQQHGALRIVKGTTKPHVGYVKVSPFETIEELNIQETEVPTRPASSKSGTSGVAMAMSPDSTEGEALHKSVSLAFSTTSSESSLVGGFPETGPPTFDDEEEASNTDKPASVMDNPEVNEVKVVFVKFPDECCPAGCTAHRWCCCQWFTKSIPGRIWWAFRCGMFLLVENKYFESFIILMILASSLALAIEDVNMEREDRKELKNVLKYMDKTFSIIFVFEMLMKWAAYGFKKYFTDAWCWLDFIIVGISLISLGAEGAGFGNMGAFRALRTLRALRPLRAVSRWEGMKVVVNALIQAIPAIFNVLLVCLVFWLIFSIMGVNLFGGRFESCINASGEIIFNQSVSNKNDCLANAHLNYSWENPKINFDNVPAAYLALFQVATFKGWINIMKNAIDSREVGQQPEPEAREGMYLYFVFFIVFGSFFTLNLFIGVIIDNFNMQKKKISGSLEMFMTEDQKKYYNAMKKLGKKKPQKPIPKPRIKCQMFFFQLATSQKFDIGIMIVILLNMATMAIEHHNEPEQLTEVLHYINIIFIAIFTLECAVKVIGLRWYYFRQPWNVFDFIVVVISILGLAMADIFSKIDVSPTLLRVVRVFRIGRILRLVKSAKGIRTLLFSLAVSLPALFNIGLLLFLVMFIYAIFGMSFFMHVRHTAGINDMFNFETFGQSMIILFQISTSAGWDSVLAGLMNDQPPDCNNTVTDERPSGDCGNSPLAVMYLVTYLVISFLVVINMYIAVILENFSQATEDVQQGLTQDDFDMYYEVWERYDEKASQYIPLDRLADFVTELEEPLRLPPPNFYKIVSLDIPICEGDQVHCVDILDALAKNFLSTGGAISADLNGGDYRKMNGFMAAGRKDYKPVSSTMRRQREIYCAHIVQKAWQRHVANRRAAAAAAAAAAASGAKRCGSRTSLDCVSEKSFGGSTAVDWLNDAEAHCTSDRRPSYREIIQITTQL